MKQAFEQERVLVGQGKMAKVYYWNGFAYKCFDNNYPKDWITYEIKIQNVINQLKLPTVKYYTSDIPQSIKMDYINGITIADRVMKEKYKNGLEDLLSIQLMIHENMGVELPRLKPYLLEKINQINVGQTNKELAIQCVMEIEEKEVLCHLDYHYLNLMYAENEYFIIDWINAKLGNPIFDFARTYVILYQHANRASKKYLTLVKKLKTFDPFELQKAIYVMALHRLSEDCSDKIKQLIDVTYESLLEM